MIDNEVLRDLPEEKYKVTVHGTSGIKKCKENSISFVFNHLETSRLSAQSVHLEEYKSICKLVFQIAVIINDAVRIINSSKSGTLLLVKY